MVKGEDRMILTRFVWLQYQYVIDGWTDRRNYYANELRSCVAKLLHSKTVEFDLHDDHPRTRIFATSMK